LTLLWILNIEYWIFFLPRYSEFTKSVKIVS